MAMQQYLVRYLTPAMLPVHKFVEASCPMEAKWNVLLTESVRDITSVTPTR